MERTIMAKNTSMLLGDHFEQFIEEQIATGRFSSASEVIRTALRLMEAEEVKKKELNKALAVGEKSGLIDGFDSKAFLKQLKSSNL
jgi:antitoxin ParD1/3/4